MLLAWRLKQPYASLALLGGMQYLLLELLGEVLMVLAA